ncbi:hypothetical protein I5E68_12565 [Novosphingobium sp. YJ-S2-02]|uniref:Uncharacterized protein n=1 Tax=Novosphingobium aureum TaxID=2792964 RepID=A0A931HE53_9SPHN|nr:hypothetical protein [Novosphingobium aureum]MBH0113778.1 hypothetical protein [Novosphingobium aureum]
MAQMETGLAAGKIARRFARWIVGALGVIVLGPVIWAAGGAAFVSLAYSDEWGRGESAKLLFDETGIARSQPPIRMYNRVDTGADFWAPGCGYDTVELIPAKTPQRLILYALGYMQHWSLGDEWNDAYAARLGNDHWQFTLEFLRRCMANSALAPLCARQAEIFVSNARIAVGQTDFVPYSEKIGLRRELMCNWLDGIATRKGVPLGTRSPSPID